MIKVAFVGNPNVGKSALINAIAGSNLKIGNWPGVTVEKKEAFAKYKGENFAFIDLPGVYSLSPYSTEEIITRDYLVDENPDIIVNVLDSTNLERNLYLTYLLLELNRPMIIALNFQDEFEKLQFSLNKEEFERNIGLESVWISAIRKNGIEELMDKILNMARAKKSVNYKLPYTQDINSALCQIKGEFAELKNSNEILSHYGSNFATIKLLERDSHFISQLKEKYDLEFGDKFNELRKGIEEKNENEDILSILAEQRYNSVNALLRDSFKTSNKSRLAITEKIDKIFLNRFLGLPLFFAVIVIFMSFVFNGSAPLIDYIDGFFGDFLGKYVKILVDGTPEWLQSLIVDGIVAGLGGVLTFVPLMVLLYFFLGLLEESGYMNRVAFLMDRLMRSLGLNGKAFVPLIIGFGCSVPAIYATRTLEDEKSKKFTAMMAPFMSCGARLPVYGLFAVAFFGSDAGYVVASLYLLGIVVAIILGLVCKFLGVYKSESSALIIELPPYRLPNLKMVLSTTSRRVGMYLKKASSVILAVLIILWALQYFPKGEAKDSYIAKFGHILQPVLAPTGFADRWETAAAIVPSIAAKEVVVGFMGQVLDTNQEEEENNATFKEDAKEQIKNLGIAFKDSIVGMLSFNLTSLFKAPGEEDIEGDGGIGVIQNTKKLWNDNLAPLRAYSFMAFILLVVPCVVTLAALRQEFGAKFMFNVIIIMTIIPYVVSTLIFQIGRLFF